MTEEDTMPDTEQTEDVLLTADEAPTWPYDPETEGVADEDEEGEE